MEITNLQEAQAHLPQLIERAAAGEEIIIAKAGKPIAKIVGYQSAPKPRKPGLWKGKIKIADDFDELPPDIAVAFGMEVK
jgi:prevent-host-death family protein